MAEAAGSSQEAKIKEEQDPKEEEESRSFDPGKMAQAAGGSQEAKMKEEQGPKEEEAGEKEEECRNADMEEWKKYRDGGRTDHESALRLMNRKYTPRKHKGFYKAMQGRDADMHKRQGMRYEAEWDYFNIRDQPVRDLMRRVTKHQYRDPEDAKDEKDEKVKLTPIDLTEKSARLVIAAARLQQETWLTLVKKITDVHRSIPIVKDDKNKSFKIQTNGKEEEKFVYFGPSETYEAKFEGRAYEVVSKHRTEGVNQKVTPSNSTPRLGSSFVIGLSYYNSDILPDLERMMSKLGQERLAELFIKFAQNHSLAGAPELSEKQRDKLFKICFLIMEKEQAQWQFSFFSGFNWQLGMSVSFARLIILFREGKITLHDVFNKPYGIYCNHGIKANGQARTMLESNGVVRDRCDLIDLKYAEHKGKPVTDLTKEDAFDDLCEVYGMVDSSQMMRGEAEPEQ